MSLASDNLITIELAIIFMASLFFSVLYENNRRESSWFGFLAGVGWLVLGVYYFVVFSQTSSYIISLLFFMVGIIYFIRAFMDIVKMEDAIEVLKDAEYM